MNSSDKNTATVRSGWQVGVFAALASILYKLTGWEISLEDLLPYSPVIAVVGAAFYRLSLVISEKLPWIGYVLFGNRKTPSGYTPPPDAE